MMFCTKCGREVLEGSAFCTNCGAQMAEAQPPGAAPPPPGPAPAQAVVEQLPVAELLPSGHHSLCRTRFLPEPLCRIWYRTSLPPLSHTPVITSLSRATFVLAAERRHPGSPS